MLQNGLQLFSAEGMDDVEEVLLGELPSLIHLWRPIRDKVCPLAELWPQCLDTDLRVMTHVDGLEDLQWYELLGTLHAQSQPLLI